MVFSHKEYNDLVNDTVDQIHKLSTLKGGEYAGDEDRLANFRRNALRIGLNMESVWHTYCVKHWDAIEQYIQDLNNGKTRERLESLEGRADDIIVYMILFKAMLRERNPADHILRNTPYRPLRPDTIKTMPSFTEDASDATT